MPTKKGQSFRGSAGRGMMEKAEQIANTASRKWKKKTD
jgi:hypothetical protein